MSEKWNRPGRYYKTLPAQHPHRWHKPERSPLFAVAAILIKLGSPGPVFFVQERLGLNKRRFRLYKFRTMVQGAEQATPEPNKEG
jgi:hypothetical protein